MIIEYDLIHDRMADDPILKAIEASKPWEHPYVQKAVKNLCERKKIRINTALKQKKH